MLGPIVEAVVHCRNPADTASFVNAAYGLHTLQDDGEQILTGVPGSSTGRLRLLPATVTSTTVTPRIWDIGPRLLGIYSRDLDRTCAQVEAAGGRTLPIARYAYGATTMREVVAAGPDGLYWTIPQANRGAHQPSPALEDPGRLHGELHSAVLVAADHDAALVFFVGAGLETVFDGTMQGEPFAAMVGMPAEATLRLSFLAPPGHAPARLEIMSFTGVSARDRSEFPLGLRRLVFDCDDIGATRAALLKLGARELADGALRGPVGIELDLTTPGERL